MKNPSATSVLGDDSITKTSNDSPVQPVSLPAGSSPAPASTKRSKSLLFLFGIVSFWALIYLPGLASPPMMDDADSEHAEIAREMLLRHDYVTMYVNGVRFLDKAPLPYWITAGSYALFGVSEFSTRLPYTLFALFSLFAVFYLGRDIAGEKAGFFAALVLGTAIGPYIYTRFVIPDIMIGFWLTITVHLFLRTLAQERPSLLLCWSIGIVTSLDVLTKGLIGVVFPIAILGTYLLITGNLRHLLRLRIFSTTAVFLAVAVPWHVLATLRNPPQGQAKGFFWFYFINEQVYRYLNMRYPRDYDKVPLLLFWGLILVWVFPWSFFVLKSLKQVPVRFSSWRGHLEKQSRGALLLAVWALVILVFFSFSTRQEYYVLPALPALALLCGMWLNQEAASPYDSTLRRSGVRSAYVMLFIGVTISAIAAAFAAVSPPAAAGADIADLLRSSPTMYKLSMGHLFDLTPRAMSVFRWPLMVTAFAFFVGTLFNWLFRKRASPMRANLALASMMVLLFYAVHVALTSFLPVLGSKPLATAIQKQYRPEDTIVVNGQYSLESSVLFYTGIQMHMLNGRTNDLWYGSLFPDSPGVFEDDASFARLWLGPGRVFFITASDKDYSILQRLRAPYYDLVRAGGKVVYSNRPISVASAK